VNFAVGSTVTITKAATYCVRSFRCVAY
jgi:hypothetical protein